MIALGILFGLSGAFTYYIFETDSGLQFTFNMVNKFIPGQLHYENLHGHLIDHITIGNLSYANKTTHLEIRSLDLSWSLSSLPEKVIIENLKVDTVNLQTSNKNKKVKTNSLNWLSRFKIQQLELSHLQYNQYKATELTLNNNNFKLLSDVGNITGTYQLAFTPDLTWQANITGSHINPAILNPQVNGDLNLQAMTEGEWDDHAQQFKIQISKLDGKLQDQPISALSDIQYQNGILKVDNTKFTIANTTSEISGTLTDRWNIKWDITIPDLHDLSAGLKGSVQSAGIITGKRNQPVFAGNFIGNNFDDVKKIQTDFIATTEFDNEIAKPTINLTLKNGNISIPRLNIDITPIQITSNMQKGGPINLKGTFAIDGNQAQLSGTYDLTKWLLNLEIVGENLPISKLQNYNIIASPNIQLSYAPSQLNISGKIEIPSADLRPNDFNDVTTLPTELEIIGDQSDDDLPLKTNLQLELNLGQNINLTYDKLTAKLGGNLTITQIPNNVPVANGELYTQDGIFNMYDRKLKIDTGKIIYTGNALNNPGIDIRASRQIKASSVTSGTTNLLPTTYTSQMIKVGIAIKGTVKKPVISYFSDEDLSQEDIMSYLIFGSPRNQVSGTAELSLLNSVALDTLSSGTSRLGLKGITEIPEKIQNKLGLDEFGIGSTDNFDKKTGTLENNIPTFNVGKQIGENLYVHYSVGLQDSSLQVFNLRYQLNKHLSIQSESSPLENGADLVYVLEK